jgi:MFS transporter, CP family, cyanate transporter
MTATSTSDSARPPDTSPSAAPAADRNPPVALAGTPVVLALFIVALALRPQLSAIGPLVPQVLAEFGPSHAFVGLLTAIPVACMGLFALAGPPVAARFGTRGGVTLSVVVLVASGILRALVPGAELVLLATFGIGVGTAVIGPIFAMFVRDRMPTQLVGGTSSYAGGTIVGAALGAAFAVPLAAALGGWRGAMLAISLVSIACLVTWILVVRGRPSPNAASAGPRRLERPRLPVRRGVVWAIAILFGLQSWLYYGQTA